MKPTAAKTVSVQPIHSNHMPRSATYLLSLLLACAATCAQADTYDIVNRGSSSSHVSFSDPSNWTIGGEPAQTCPQSGDAIRFGTGSQLYNAYLDLDDDYTIQHITQNYQAPYLYKSVSAMADTVTFTITGNIGNGGYQYFHVYDGVKLVFPQGSTYNCAYWDGGAAQMNVHSGGTVEIKGAVTSRHIRYVIDDGGKLVFEPTSYSASNFSGQYDRFTVANGALLDFPNGLNVSGGNNSTLQIIQNGGVITFGGGFTSVAPWTYAWNAGTLAIADDGMFAANIALTVPAAATVTLDVASGKTFSAPGLVADASATITKTGAGTFAFAPTAASLVLEEGALGLASASTYDLSSVSLGAGATASIALAAMGARVDSLPAALSSATFAADLSSVAQGTVIFYSSDPSVLAKVQADLASSVPQGFQLAVSGEALSLEAVSDYVFNTSGDLLNSPSSWSTGSLPPAGAEVAIDGANVVADFTAGEIPAWASIEVKNGATLKISADADLPHIVLNKNATLEIAAGTTFFTNGLFCTPAIVGESVSLPVLSVATNATLSVAAGMKFKNVDFRLHGTVTKGSDADDSPVFGYAENGETSYFALTADGGVFDFHSNQSAGKGSVSIVCPASGGTVVPVGTITLRNSSRTVNGWADFGNWEFGVNNPANVSFDVLVDGTHLDCSSYFYAAGGAHLTLVNGAYIRRNTSCLGHYFSQAIQGSASVAVGEGCFLDFATGDGSFGIDSQSVVDAVIVRDGGAYTVSYNSSGYGLGVFVSDGGILGVTKLYKPSNGDPRARTDLLRGFGSVRLDGDLEIASVNMGTGNYDWDRHVKMANVPFTGTGDVVITNSVPAYPFTVTLVNGNNTAAGSIKVDKVEGDAETALFFADGANWAGTVVAGNVSLTNLTDGAAAANVDFGTLDLAANFPIRVWTDSEGSIETNDMLKVGTYVNNGGRLAPISAADGEVFTAAGRIVVGKIGKDSPLPTAARGWSVRTSEILGDDANLLLTLKPSSGLQVILR